MERSSQGLDHIASIWCSDLRLGLLRLEFLLLLLELLELLFLLGLFLELDGALLHRLVALGSRAAVLVGRLRHPRWLHGVVTAIGAVARTINELRRK